MAATLLVGLMSGTSMDGVDAVLVNFDNSSMQLQHCLERPIPVQLRSKIHALSHPGDNEIEQLGVIDRELGVLFAEAVLQLLLEAGVSANDVRAIGSHGQTVRHRPPSAQAAGQAAFSLQIGDPNTIAELTGVTTVADFRRRDLAAGGEGAPLAPAFHAAMFSSDHCNRAIVNIGGLANLTLLPASGGGASGFDTGPGNTLLDQWVQKHTTAHYDADGEWAAEGRVHTELLAQLARHPFLRKQPPKSTGKETFNMDWLTGQLTGFATVTSRDVQATLAEFTAATIVDAIQSQPVAVSEVYICGGGAANQDLMRRLYQRLGNIKLGTTTELGCDPGWVEAAAFAWLAERTLNGESGSLPAVTGAAGGRILGGIYPGGNPAAQK